MTRIRPVSQSAPSTRPLTPYQLTPAYMTLVEPEHFETSEQPMHCFGCNCRFGYTHFWGHLRKHAQALAQVCDDAVKVLTGFEVRLLPEDKREASFKSI